MLGPLHFSLKSKPRRCLKYIKCSSIDSEVHKENVKLLNSLNIFHQNVRRLKSSDELIYAFETDSKNPHVLCLSEHHMVEQELLHPTIPGYSLGLSFCQKSLQRGVVCIFVRKDQCFNKINISQHCKK